MKFTLSINFDSSDANDKKLFREMSALLNSTAAGQLPIPPVGGEDDEDDSGTVAVVAPGEVDSAGLPWDERIHSGAKSKTDKGVWRIKKGASADLVKSVEAELRARVATPASVAPPAPPTPASAPPVSVAPPPSPAVVAPPPAPPPPEAAPPAPPAAPPSIDFAGFMAKYSAAQQAGKVDAAFTTWLFGQLGITDFAGMATNADVVVKADNLMTQHNRYVA